MNKILLSVVMLVLVAHGMAQAPLPRTYDYDAAGNRVLRSTIELRQIAVNSADDEFADMQDSDTKNLYFEEFVDQNRVKIYPNPTHGFVMLRFERPVEKGYFQLTSLSGKLLIEGKIHSTTVEIDLSDFQSGVYMLTLFIYGVAETWKIIKK